MFRIWFHYISLGVIIASGPSVRAFITALLPVEDIIRSVLEEEEAKPRKPGDWATMPTEGEEEVGEARPYQDISNQPIRTGIERKPGLELDRKN